MKVVVYYTKCKKCNCEKAKVDTTMVLTSLPPKYKYNCPECGHVGYILTSEISTGKIADVETDGFFLDDLEVPIMEGKLNQPSSKENEINSNTITPIYTDNILKLIKLMYFCGVNDIGALENGNITQEEYDFIQQTLKDLKVR